jgi:membrane fusion protein (multidrug efflux system)
MSVPTTDVKSFFQIALLLLVCAGCKKSRVQSVADPDAATQVVVVNAEHAPMNESLSLVGIVRANESVDIKAQVAGVIETIGFEEGRPVEKGALLIELDTDKLRASLDQAEANQRLAESKFARARDLAQSRGVTLQELEEASATFDASRANVDFYKRQIEEMRIVAPFSGVIGARLISPGQVVAPQQMLTTIVDLDPVKVELNVPQQSINRVEIGEKIELRVPALPGEKFAGEVYFIAPQLDPMTGAGVVKARVKNADVRLKPGMFANLDLTLKIKEASVTIPEPCLIPQGEEAMVYTVDEQMIARMRRVRPGLRKAGRVEILEGLAPGERVILEGWQKMRPGGKVTFAPSPRTVPGGLATEQSARLEREKSEVE